MRIIAGKTDEETERERRDAMTRAILRFARPTGETLEDIVAKTYGGALSRDEIAKDIHDCETARAKREKEIAIKKKRERGGWIVLLILVLIGMVIAAIAK